MRVKFFRLTEVELNNPNLRFVDKIHIEMHRAEEDAEKYSILESEILQSEENVRLQALYQKQIELENSIDSDYEILEPFFKKNNIPTDKMSLYRNYLNKIEKLLPPIRYEIRQLQEKYKISAKLNEVRNGLYLARKEIKFLEAFLQQKRAS